MSDESEGETENVFDADCCKGIAAVVVVVAPFCGGGNSDGKEDVEGRVAAIGAGAFCVSAGADCVSNSGGGTWICNFHQLGNFYQDNGAYLRCCVHARNELSALTVALIVLLQQLASLLVEGRVRIRVDE